MAFSYIKRLFEQLKRSRWIQIYFTLVILQTILSVPILVKTLLNTEYANHDLSRQLDTNENDRLFGDYFDTKGHRVRYENVLFLAYESWRLWMLTDGIVHLNSLTILASAWFSVFSCVFNVLLVFESHKWIESDKNSLIQENMRLQIGLTVIFFIISVPVIIAAYKTSKIIGWQVYKKIGSSIELQNMYHCVQCFALVLKINIFFQVLFLISTSIITHNYVFRIITAVMSGIIMISIVFSRISITRESHWMMCIFLAFQLILLICIAYCIVGLFQYSDLWTIGMVYSIASIISVLSTMFLAIRCQLNFKQGLKKFVKWYPFQPKNKDEDDSLNNTESRLINRSVEEGLPIDEDDDEEYKKGFANKGKFIYNSNSSRTSLERVNILPYQVQVERFSGKNKLNSISILQDKPQPIVPRLPMQPIFSNTSNVPFSQAVTVKIDADFGDESKPPPYTSTTTTTITTTKNVKTTILSLPQSEKW